MLRSSVTSTYHQKCPISGFHSFECEVAHIIPRAVCHHLELPFINESLNCILLSKGLHFLFDHFKWTLDVYSAKSSAENAERVELKILQAPDFNTNTSIIGHFKDNTVNVHVGVLPFLYVHYNVFLAKNYSQDGNNMDIIELFKYFTADEPDFKNMLEKGFYNHLSTKNMELPGYRYIIGKRDSQYKVLWNYYPHSASTWENEENLNQDDIELYNTFLEYKTDPTFVP